MLLGLPTEFRADGFPVMTSKRSDSVCVCEEKKRMEGSWCSSSSLYCCVQYPPLKSEGQFGSVFVSCPGGSDTPELTL